MFSRLHTYTVQINTAQYSVRETDQCQTPESIFKISSDSSKLVLMVSVLHFKDIYSNYLSKTERHILQIVTLCNTLF
jgi:hypothetical protein